jgi:hypothetical protein
MPLRTRLIRALDEEIPVSPREFTVEARQASISIAQWKREHPREPVIEVVVFEAVRGAMKETWGVAAIKNWDGALHRVARRLVESSREESRRGNSS